jgi:hypothetical protein
MRLGIQMWRLFFNLKILGLTAAYPAMTDIGSGIMRLSSVIATISVPFVGACPLPCCITSCLKEVADFGVAEV